ncbi:protein-tyrosine phosphatase-like protein [Cokeromyces recurvatus]|uniref:protein-tyrosine phosphatase-like protein n=1 Tax=Cokeromyces recurvatus TaxID=90255 RepID=UPI00221EF451|nr:protein-tyrosine phosphatase-like protein [Cokeromyces recurvatus]KAI7907985.1 protein-tyrosine phosphatase-like protein [Cokeromyces recurvatus]
MQPSRIDLLKITQVKDVLLTRSQETVVGNLHLTVHHLIFCYSSGEELWIPYSIIHTVERQPPSLQSGRYPLHIKCRDFMIITLSLLKDGETQDVFDSIQKLACVTSIEQLYAYSYMPRTPFTATNGWNIYDPLKEYGRMGVDVNTDAWRFTLINRDYKYSPTYPRILVVPSKISDNTLNYAAKYRSKARIPALSYLHWHNSATITRSSQPLVGFKQARSIQDEKLIEAIFSTNVPKGPNGEVVYGSTATNLIIDARPMANAVGNVARGAGTENMDHYRNCKKIYVAIDNIHVMRDSLGKLSEGMDSAEGQINRVTLQKSGWLKHISMVMEGAITIIKNIHVYNSHVLVHCSDGWDRTSQLVSLSELCLDPYYRTFEGIQVLIEKDWISFGHKFEDRCGHLSNEKYFVNLANTSGNTAASTIKDMQNKFYKSNYYQREISPVFHQFLDCVYQLLCLYPTRFQFNEQMLIELHYHVYSCQFGTFLFNSEKERISHHPQDKTFSIWDYFNSNKKKFTNELYDPMKDKDLVDDGGVLMPDASKVKYWASLFKRDDNEVNSLGIAYGLATLPLPEENTSIVVTESAD